MNLCKDYIEGNKLLFMVVGIREAACSIYRTSTNLCCVNVYILCLCLRVCVDVSVFSAQTMYLALIG